MGGYGSGRGPARHSTVGGCHSIDVRQLQWKGALRPRVVASLSWSANETEQVPSSIGPLTHEGTIALSYNYRRRTDEEWIAVEEPIRLTRTQCNYGGERPWFICPGASCYRRVAILYGAGKYYLCRHCYNLVYASQRWDPGDRLMEKARSIRMRLGGSVNLLEPFPNKPMSMHWRTYWRLRTESEQADLASWYAGPFSRQMLRGMV